MPAYDSFWQPPCLRNAQELCSAGFKKIAATPVFNASRTVLTSIRNHQKFWEAFFIKWTISLWGILDFKFAPAKNTPPNPAIFSADFGSDMQNKLPGCIFFYVPWCPGSLGPPGHVFRKKLICRQWKLQIHRDWVWLCMAADFLLIHEKSAAESGFLGCAAKPLAF